MFSSSPARFKSPFYKSQWSKGGVIESSRAATFPFPPFFAPLQTHPLGIRENDRSESSRLASNRKGRDNCGQRRCSTVRLLPPDSQLSACRMTNDVISTHLRHEHALDRLFSSRQEEFKCSLERERESTCRLLVHSCKLFPVLGFFLKILENSRDFPSKDKSVSFAFSLSLFFLFRLSLLRPYARSKWMKN